MNTISFTIYTLKHGHTVVSFDAYNKAGQDAFQQATEYALNTYNDSLDKPKLFLMTEIPLPENPLRSPVEWEASLHVELVDMGGRDKYSTLGYKSGTEPITEKEFLARCEESCVWDKR